MTAKEVLQALFEWADGAAEESADLEEDGPEWVKYREGRLDLADDLKDEIRGLAKLLNSEIEELDKESSVLVYIHKEAGP